MSAGRLSIELHNHREKFTIVDKRVDIMNRLSIQDEK